MKFSSLAGKMFKALSEKKKQKYVELARVAREEYKKQVQEFKWVIIIEIIIFFLNVITYKALNYAIQGSESGSNAASQTCAK